MVRLKAMKTALEEAQNKYFNSFMVRLKVHERNFDKECFLYFNSFMVRLKDNTSEFAWRKLVFQFLYGAIKRPY